MEEAQLCCGTALLHLALDVLNLCRVTEDYQSVLERNILPRVSGVTLSCRSWLLEQDNGPRYTTAHTEKRRKHLAFFFFVGKCGIPIKFHKKLKFLLVFCFFFPKLLCLIILHMRTWWVKLIVHQPEGCWVDSQTCYVPRRLTLATHSLGPRPGINRKGHVRKSIWYKNLC